MNTIKIHNNTYLKPFFYLLTNIILIEFSIIICSITRKIKGIGV